MAKQPAEKSPSPTANEVHSDNATHFDETVPISSSSLRTGYIFLNLFYIYFVLYYIVSLC